jgi:hypothetical protein
VFLPPNRITFRKAAARISRRMAKNASLKKSGSLSLKEQEYLGEGIEELGRMLAGELIDSFGMVTQGWWENEYTAVNEGEEIKLPAIVWRRSDTKHRMTDPPEEHWMPGEIAYEGGRVLPVLDEDRIASVLDLFFPEEATDDPVTSASLPNENDSDLVPPSLPNDPPSRFACMVGYAHAFKVHGRVVKRGEALSAMTKITGCTTRQAEAAYEALPYPELRNPPPVARAGSTSDKLTTEVPAAKLAGAEDV